MFCPFCGVENPEQAKYCKNCGKLINGEKTIVKFDKEKRIPQKQPPKKTYDGVLRIASPIVSIILCSLIMIGSTIGLVWENNQVYAATGNGDNYNSSTTNAAKPGKVEYDLEQILKQEVGNIKIDNEVNSEDAIALENEINIVASYVSDIKTELAVEYPRITEYNVEDYMYDLSKYVNELKEQGLIIDYEYSSSALSIKLENGGNYVFLPEIEGSDAGASGNFELKVATYQPCLSSYSGLDSYMKYVDRGAQKIDNKFEKYVFNSDDNYDDEEVSANAIASFGEYNVVLWHGHGGHNSEIGSVMVSGIKCTSENYNKYTSLITSGILYPSDDTYLIGYKFFDLFVEDGALDNSIIYLGACSSGKDKRLAETLINKGAEAVYANSDTIHTVYNLKMIESVSEGLTKLNNEGRYNSISQALEYAKAKNGGYDTGELSSTKVVLFTENNDFALDWYESHIKTERSVMLVLDNSGSMSGDPIEETRKASINFVDSVIEQNAAIGVATFDDNAVLRSDFTLNKTILSNSINAISESGSTNIYAGLKLAKEQLDDSKSDKKIIVLMSDGLPNCDLTGNDLIEYANTLKNEGFYIYTLGFFSSLSGASKQEAQELMRNIASSGCYYDIDDSDNIVYFFDDVATQINGQKYIYIRIACPVDVKVSYKGETLDSSSNNTKTRTSFGSLTFEEISESNESNDSTDGMSVENNDMVKVLRLLEGVQYDIEIEGTGRGKMDYTISYMDNEGEYNDVREFKRIPITRDTIINTKTNSTKKTVLEVDEDGDGKVDNIYVADKDSKGELLKRTLRKVLFYSLIVSSIALVVSIIVLTARVRKHKNWLLKKDLPNVSIV